MTQELDEGKDSSRYTLVISKERNDKLDEVKKVFGVSKNDIIITLIDSLDIDTIAPLLVAKRESKIDGRTTRHAVHKQLIESVSGLTPEQLAVVNETIAKMKKA